MGLITPEVARDIAAIIRDQPCQLARNALTVLAGTSVRAGELASLRVGWWQPECQTLWIRKDRPRDAKEAR